MGKYTEETKLAVVEDYCSGTAGLKVVARRHDVDVSSLRKWVASYRSHGAAGVREKERAAYSVKFKLSVLRHMRDEGLSYRQAAALFDIRNFNIIATWERNYDQGGLDALSPYASFRRKKMKKQSIKEPPRPSQDDDRRTREELINELSLAIGQMLTDPQRILEVRRHLHMGAHVMYFDHRRGALAPGRVLQLLPTQVTLQDDITRSQRTLPYAAIMVDPAQRTEQDAPPVRPRPIDMPEFKLGDTVGFTASEFDPIHLHLISRSRLETH